MTLLPDYKTILITGATDGIGLETARALKKMGHRVLLHGRNEEKLNNVGNELESDTFLADFSRPDQVKAMGEIVLSKYPQLDILINNAGVFKTSQTKTQGGFDIRYMVNTFAPYILTKKLLPALSGGRVINLSSAAQASVDFDAMRGKVEMNDFEAYAQSKLAITMWTRFMSQKLGETGPIFIVVNPASLLGTKMVKEGFNTSGNDIGIGVDILVRLSLDSEHEQHSGDYYDNDSKRYAPPQADGLDDEKAKQIVEFMEEIL
jgi:NAD(P)-dependent dehydrogenase (short-subunit alcohol dehydrogenase family)